MRHASSLGDRKRDSANECAQPCCILARYVLDGPGISRKSQGGIDILTMRTADRRARPAWTSNHHVLDAFVPSNLLTHCLCIHRLTCIDARPPDGSRQMHHCADTIIVSGHANPFIMSHVGVSRVLRTWFLGHRKSDSRFRTYRIRITDRYRPGTALLPSYHGLGYPGFGGWVGQSTST